MNDPAADNGVLHAWRSTLARDGNRAAIFAATGAVERTFADIEQEAVRLDSLFCPFSQGAVIAVQIGNDPAWPALLLALFRRSLIPLPLGQHMEAGELASALETCRVAALITRACDGLRVGAQPFGTSVAWPEPAPDFLKLTSGTTASPRAVRFRAKHLIADCGNICQTMGITAADVNYGAIPFSHSYGFSNLLLPLLIDGVALVATDDRLPRAILHGLAGTGSTVFPGTPILFQKLGELDDVPPLPALRLCISAGAPLTSQVAAQFHAKFAVTIHTFYGASECGGIAYERGDSSCRGEGYVGSPMCGVEVERQTGDDPAPITISGAAVSDGYFPPEEAGTLAEGRFTPSDLIRWVGNCMFIAGRVTDVINVAGRKLNPREIEERVLACPGVNEAVVFAVPSTLRGEEPILCVVADRNIDAASVLHFCTRQLSAWQIPKDVWIVDELPVNERGKVSRRFLAARYLSLRSNPKATARAATAADRV